MTGWRDRQVRTILLKIAPQDRIERGTNFVVNEPKLHGISVIHLFKEGRALTTLMFWIVFFMSLLDLYLLSSWLPTVLNDIGATISVAAIVGAMLQVGGVVGTFTLGQFIDRFSFKALAVTYLLAAISVGAVGYSGKSIPVATLAIFCAGFCIVGGQIASNALAAHFYPTAIRSTGVGWALGIGRAGSIIGPLVGGAMMANNVSSKMLFLAASCDDCRRSVSDTGAERQATRQERLSLIIVNRMRHDVSAYFLEALNCAGHRIEHAGIRGCQSYCGFDFALPIEDRRRQAV